MRKIFNNRAETPRRQQLRAEMPVAERLLWKHLRNEALGVKFRRQVSIGKYVLDFIVCRFIYPSKSMANRTRAKSRKNMTKRGRAKSKVWESGLFA